MENAPQSQVEVTCKLVEIAAQMPDVRTPADLGLLRDTLLAHLTFRSYNKASWEHERSIRWKRTATEILSDGWVYEAKGCTDIVIAFIGLCRAKGLATRFVKVRSNTGKQHSLAEIYHSGTWWLVETVVPGMAPIEGEMKEETQYKIWKLWRKGLDSWSIGLKDERTLFGNYLP